MTHEAVIVPGSIQDLGRNGIAFSVICCDDPNTIQRHTIQDAHAVSTEELMEVIEREYLQPHAENHHTTSIHTEQLRKLAETRGLTGNSDECRGCK